MTRAWLALVALAASVLVALAVRAAWLAIAAHAGAVPPLPQATGYEAEAHFPGAALLYAAADRTDAPVAEQAAPAVGVTGTIALPPLPAAVARAALGPSMQAGAAPFSTRAATAIDRGRALECLTAAVYYEAASESDAGQAAVAQVVLNRVRHPAFPATVCGVVYQGSEHAGCQFSFACDGAMARVPSRSGWARAARSAAKALAGYVYAPVGLATHYHTYAVTPAWNRTLVLTDVVGAHLFHRWKGPWGTAAAFGRPYRGGEPLPGPHAPPLLPVTPAAPALIAAAAPVPVAPVTPAAEVRAPYADSGRALSPVAAAGEDHLPPASTVLDKWKDSGTPLR
ncbi:cell wall hydrolase [Sphingomonas sp. XXL09]|uniref:cell wall hydrolase n=1 Tax=Sphingomonas sp. XXL09 TaxID=3457787 RepID=UPI00406BA367